MVKKKIEFEPSQEAGQKYQSWNLTAKYIEILPKMTPYLKPAIHHHFLVSMLSFRDAGSSSRIEHGQIVLTKTEVYLPSPKTNTK